MPTFVNTYDRTASWRHLAYCFPFAFPDTPKPERLGHCGCTCRIGTAEMSGELVGTLRQAAMPAQRAGRQSVEAGQPKVRGSDGETTMVPSASGASPPRARTGRATAKAVNPWNTIGNPEEAPIAASNLKVAQLKEELKKLGLPTSGRKHDLVVRLEAARKTPP